MRTAIFIIILLLKNLLIIPQQSLAQCHIDDWTALKAFYNSTNGNNWTDNTGWVAISGSQPLVNCDLNLLYGVLLNDNGRVKSLNFDGNNLRGIIPSELGNLSELTYLKLVFSINGTIPSSLGNLSKLTHLIIKNKELNPAPGSLGAPGPPGPLPGSNDSQDISTPVIHCLNGNIPPEFGNLINLTYLSLESKIRCVNVRSGPGPPVQNGIETFGLSGNIPIEIGNLNKLDTLNLTNNLFTGSLSSILGDFKKLTYLNLSKNQFTGSIPSSLGDLSKLKRLDLHSNQLSGSIPSSIGDLKNLLSLNLNSNRLSGNIPSSIGNLSNLQNLTITNNQLSGNIPSSIGNLGSLIKLDLSRNQLSESIPSIFNNLKQLSYLDLSRNLFSGSIPDELSNLNQMTELYLFDNKLKGSIPSELSKLNMLTKLYLSNNQLTEEIPSSLGNLDSLTYLDLSRNQLSGSIPIELGNLSNLTGLYLNNNQLSGNIPTEIGGLAKLTTFYLSDNQLSGTIPSDLGNLSKLAYIQFSRNQLSGSIPEEFGGLSELIYLHLAGNQLKGIIPKITFSQDTTGISGLPGPPGPFGGQPTPGGEAAPGPPGPPGIDGAPDSPVSASNSTEILTPSGIVALNVKYNHFTCADIDSNFLHNQENDGYNYLPQNFIPLNYDSLKTNIFNLPNNNLQVILNPQFPWEDESGFSYQWKKNGNIIPGANQPSYIIEDIQPNNVGRYTLHVKNYCLPSVKTFETASEPMYVILKNYDLYGQPVEYDQVMVEFYNSEETKQYEDDILTPNAGWVAKSCNCNRELYLWQFPSTDDAVAALLEIDKKSKKLKRKNKAKGGFNNKLNIGETGNTSIAYNVISEAFNGSYPDSVTVFILDSGIDLENYDATPFLYDHAPVDRCYEGNPSSGFSYIDSAKLISTNYKDDLWHGTFGFRSITEKLHEDIDLKLVPLKIFNDKGEGNLFDMTCALYHAIDNGADIVNISAGYQGEPSGILESAINYAREKGVFITAAAGNDSQDIDSIPHYPASYASQYYVYETFDNSGKSSLDSLKYDHVVSVASINEDGIIISPFSNFGEESVTLAAYGNNIYGFGLAGLDVVASGTSMSTYFATKALALEIANNRNRSYTQVLKDFKKNWLVRNLFLVGKIQRGRQLNFELIPAEIKGCMDETACNYFSFANIDDDSCNYNCQNDQTSLPDAATGPPGPAADAINIDECPREDFIDVNTPISLNIGESKNLMDLVYNNTTGYWSGKNIIHVLTLDGESIPYFSSNKAGVYKLYYTIKNEYCEQSYILIVQVENDFLFTNKTAHDFDDYFRFVGEKNKSGFTLSPNPANDIVNLNITNKYGVNNLVTLFDLNGKILFRREFEGKQTILDITGLFKGVYMIELQNTENTSDKSIQKLLIH